MIEVELPDGTILEFPEGTAPDVMKQAAAKYVAGNTPQAAPPPQPAPERGMGQAIYDNLIGDPTDGVQSYGEGLGTWLNRAGESMTLGLVGDEASAAATGMLPGRDYQGELERYRGNEANMSGLGRVSADVAGAVLPAMAGLGIASTAKTIPGMIAKGGAIGAGQGATLGFMEGEGGASERMGGAAMGAGLGAAMGGLVAPAVGGLVNKALQGSANNRAIASMVKGAPSTDELRAAGNAAYQAVDDAGVQIKPEAFASARDRILNALRANTGYDELPGPGSLTPNTSRVMEIMGQAGNKMGAEPTAALPFKALDQMRRQAGAAAGNVTNKADMRAGTEVIQGLDDFVNRLGPDDVVAGDVKALQEAIPKARETWSRMTKSQMLDDAIDAGSNNYLGGAGSGIRNQFASLLRNKKAARGFTDLEKAAMRRVVNGTLPEKMVNLLGGGMGQLVTMGSGMGVGGLPGLALGTAVAAGARKGSEAIVGRNAEIARALVAQGVKGAGALPQISQTPRQVIEALIRRSGEVGRQ